MKLITVFICCQKINQRFGRFNSFLSMEDGLSSMKQLIRPEITIQILFFFMVVSLKFNSEVQSLKRINYFTCDYNI